MARKEQKVVRWRKVLKAMGACGYLETAFSRAGEPATLDGMLEYMQRPGSSLTREHVVGLIQKNGLLDEAFTPLRPRLEGRGFPDRALRQLWTQPFTSGVIARLKAILERESDARGLTEWI